MTGKITSQGDRDWFKLQLKRGDVVGVAMQGKGDLDSYVRLVNSSGKLSTGKVAVGGSAFGCASALTTPTLTTKWLGFASLFDSPGDEKDDVGVL